MGGIGLLVVIGLFYLCKGIFALIKELMQPKGYRQYNYGRYLDIHSNVVRTRKDMYGNDIPYTDEKGRMINIYKEAERIAAELLELEGFARPSWVTDKYQGGSR